MPRYLALEWDLREARIAAASPKGEGVLLEEAFSVPFDAGADKTSLDPQAGEKIAAALADRKLRGGDVLVAVGRTSTELKQLSFPPVPDAELPEMVRLQAMREFHSLGESWPLDYVPLSSQPDQPRSVLAAAISPEQVEQMQKLCETAGLKPQRMVLRPCAAASLFLRGDLATAEPVRLLIDILPEEADLTVLVDRDPVLMRTARLPHEFTSDMSNIRPLVAEIRRTMAAANNQLGGPKVSALYVCGIAEQAGDLASRIEQELNLPTRLFDPLAELQVDGPLRRHLPASLGRFAPLLGMLADEIQEVAPAMDFLNPHRPPEPPSQRNKYAAIAAAAGLLVAAVGLWGWLRLASLDRQIEQLTLESKKLDTVVKQADQLDKAAQAIRDWAFHDINWLEEMKELSTDFPEAKEAMLTNLRLATHPEGGMMQIDGVVREIAVVTKMQQDLRDDRHAFESKGNQQDKKLASYPWSFRSSVVVQQKETVEQE
jgi:Tfp pilus assembly PilM family ATPase